MIRGIHTSVFVHIVFYASGKTAYCFFWEIITYHHFNIRGFERWSGASAPTSPSWPPKRSSYAPGSHSLPPPDQVPPWHPMAHYMPPMTSGRQWRGGRRGLLLTLCHSVKPTAGSPSPRILRGVLRPLCPEQQFTFKKKNCPLDLPSSPFLSTAQGTFFLSLTFTLFHALSWRLFWGGLASFFIDSPNTL